MNEIISAVHALLQVCDGAKAKDGSGFNKPDSDFVRSVVHQGYAPTQKQLVALHATLQKYKVQLAGMGINYDAIPVPHVEKEMTNGEEIAERMHESAKNYKLNFGKFKGHTLAETAKIDVQYLSWLAGTQGENAIIAKKALNGEALPEIEVDLTIRLDIEAEKIIIHSPREMAEVCKSLSERKWNPDKKRWEAPLKNLDEVIATFKDAILSPALQTETEKQKALKDMATKAQGKQEIKLKNGLALLPFQSAGVEFVEAVDGKALIADEMGLGKTIEALAYLYRHPDQRPAIITCPASLKLNWEREAQKWLAETEKIQVINGAEAKQGTIVIINYDILEKHAEYLKNLKAQAIILDESHYIKNYKAKRTKFAQELCKEIPHRILLTGTPILNRPCEIWTQLNIVRPQEYDNFFSFGKRYCNAKKTRWGWDFGGASNGQELHERLKTIAIRRKKAEVMTELPPKRRAYIPFKISNQKDYNEASENTIAFIQEKKGQGKADAATRAEMLARIELLKQVAVQGKMEAIQNWIDAFLESGEKLVVFATHHFVIDALMEKYGAVAVKLTGDDSQEARQKAVDNFQNRPETRLFIGNIQAAGVGITLTAASNVAILELGWNPATMMQAEDRVHRIGQKNAINVSYLLARNTIDETIARLLEEKSANIDAAMDGKEVAEYTVLDKLIEGL